MDRMETEASYDLILGTAGHIDHGKTSLIKALTGVDTDRLPEEKKRGITIELGYAHLDLPPYRLGIVDVPGHERFIRQMLAGATGMNLVMLIVAADDSIKQQTYEHLDILRLLNLSAGVIVITKADLVEPDWLLLVEMEVRQLVEGTFLENAPLIPTSAKEGRGIHQLKQAIQGECERLIPPQSEPSAHHWLPFRMAIDRAFSIAGHGTVVTGSVASGRLDVGEVIEILPTRSSSRIRGLQTHDDSVESVHVGQRAALNLAGIGLDAVERGHELAAPGYLLPSDRLLVNLTVLDRATAPLKNRERIRFHIGTAEIEASVDLLGAAELVPGQSGLTQLFLSESATSSWGQPFVVRRPSPMETIGGGVVVHSNSSKIKFKNLTTTELELLDELTSSDLLKRASAVIYFGSDTSCQPLDLIRLAAVTDPLAILNELKFQNTVVEYPISASRSGIVHRLYLEMIAQRVLEVLGRLHRDHPLRFSHPRFELNNEFHYLEQPLWLELAVDILKKRKLIEANINQVALVGSGPQLSKSQKQLLEQLIEQFRASGLAAPSVSDLQSAAPKNKGSVEELLALAAGNGTLVRVSDELYLHPETLERIQQTLQAALENSVGLSTSELRQALDTTRKYAIPILEYFDKIGVTVRNGDLRTLAHAK
jgi:selenocysteine-specific elongation factor